MKRGDYDFFRSWVRRYIARYDTGDEYVNVNVGLKKEHTFHVCRNAAAIGKELGLDAVALMIAETAALFHDIGRFEQMRRYRTFNDSRSENHALLGVRIIEEHAILGRLPRAEGEIITRAVRYHNLRSLPSEEDPDVLVHAKLLRDADKLDIYRVVTEYHATRRRAANPAVELDLPDTPEYSAAIIGDILAGRCADGACLATYNDMKLFELSWIFDINFVPTFRRLRRHRYIDRIVAALPDTGDIRLVRRRIEDHVTAMLR